MFRFREVSLYSSSFLDGIMFDYLSLGVIYDVDSILWRPRQDLKRGWGEADNEERGSRMMAGMMWATSALSMGGGNK